METAARWKPWKNELHVFPPFPQPLLLSISKKKEQRRKDALMEGLGQTGMDKSEREA
jgi:hypothetical protein